MPKHLRNNPHQIKISSKKRIGLVCSGGGSKAGAFHIGVALALRERGFKFYGGILDESSTVKAPGPMDISIYVGSSAGSIIASCLAAGYTLDSIVDSFVAKEASGEIHPVTHRPLPKLTYQKMFKINPQAATSQIKQLLRLKNLASGLMQGDVGSFLEFKWLKMNGLFSTSGLESFMREEVLPSNNFQDYPADLFITGTKLNHSRKVVFGKYQYTPPPEDLTCEYNSDVHISEACAASTALPPMFSPYSITQKDGVTHAYIDGEIRDTLSTHVAVDAGADLVFASYTHQPYHFHPDFGSLTDHGIAHIAVQSIYLLIEQKINQYIHSKKKSAHVYDAVNRYCRENIDISESHRKKILEIIEKELDHKMNVDMIYIHPKPDDAQMFMREHFSLSPKKMASIVRSGFKAATEILSKYSFEDYVESPIIGRASEDPPQGQN